MPGRTGTVPPLEGGLIVFWFVITRTDRIGRFTSIFYFTRKTARLE